MTDAIQALWLRPRLLAALGVTAAALALPLGEIGIRALAGWCLGVTIYVALTLHRLARLPLEALRREATELDDSAPAISLLAILAGAASCGAVAMIVLGERHPSGGEGWRLGLAGLTIVCAWAFVQVVFANHYAHVYYGDDETGQARGGLAFPGGGDPDIWDFLYFSVTVGATSQTSDTGIASKAIRRIVTAHGTYAYFFNTSVLALAINMAAGFAQR